MSEATVAQIARALAFNEQHVSFAITLMEHLVVPTFVLDAEQRVLIWNKACERLTDIPAAEVVGTRDHWRAFYETPRPCLADLVATGHYGQIAELNCIPSSKTRPNRCSASMPRTGAGCRLAASACTWLSMLDRCSTSRAN